MSNKNNEGSEIFLGGAITVVIIGAFLLEAIKKFFLKVELTFQAFTKMAGSFIDMALAWGIIISCVVLAIGSIIAGIYFTYRYIKLVRQGTEIIDCQLELTSETKYFCRDLIKDLKKETDEEIKRLRNNLGYLDEKLEEALKAPEASPQVSAPEEITTPSESSEIETSSQSNDPSPGSTSETDTANHQSLPTSLTNPY